MKNILVICPVDEDFYNLYRPHIRQKYNFIYEGAELWRPEKIDGPALIDQILDRTKTIQIDGVIATEDYPASIIAAIITEKLGLIGPEPQAILKCQNKYISRSIQARSVSEAIPSFELIKTDGISEPKLSFPFFIKPVKSYLSMMSYEVKNIEELDSVLKMAKEKLPAFSKNFNCFMDAYLPNELTQYRGHYMLAEEVVKGKQVSTDGYIHEGEIRTIATFDSNFIPGTRSFSSFNYPSKLPVEVIERKEEIVTKVLSAIGLDNCMFNIEFMYDQANDSIKIIEINPRMAPQFADLIERVDGMNPYEILIEIALGNKPKFIKGKGQSRVAISYPLRLHEDMKVLRAPTNEELGKINEQYLDVSVHCLVDEGNKLSDYPQDSYTYRYCIVNVAGPNRKFCDQKLEEIRKLLSFEFTETS